MRTNTATTATSGRPDRKSSDPFALVTIISLSVACLIPLIILTAWRDANVRLGLPDGWWQMQANTALTILVLALGLLLPYRRRPLMRRGRQICGGVALAIATQGQMEIWGTQPAEYCSFLVADNLLPLVQPMGFPSAICLLLLGGSLLIEPSRQNLPGQLIDAALMVLVILNLVYLSAYLFDAGLLVGLTETTCLSPHTLACIALMTFVLAGQRAPFGFLAVLIGDGLGSRLARRLLPMAVIMSFLIIVGGERLQASSLLSLPNAEAVTAAFTAVLMITVVILLARRINNLERGLRDMSLSDELTGLHNFRGFHQFAEESLHDARQHSRPAMLLFFDVDGLKKVNDSLGHEIGSQLLKDFAVLLKETFRGSDIVGRVGGDEFAVITSGRHQDMSSVLQRLHDATRELNASSSRPYVVSFSVGMEKVDSRYLLTLPELMANADAAMYRHKRQKRARSAAGRNMAEVAPAVELQPESAPTQ